MKGNQVWERHYEEAVVINSTPDKIFDFADDYHNLASHMNQSSWMMAGSKMDTTADVNQGKSIGSHIMMEGKICGLNLVLDEVITERERPYKKTWKTVGMPHLIVIGNYQLGFEVKEHNGQSRFRVFIDYDLPERRWFGILFGGFYAKWCVRQMSSGVVDHFRNS